MRRCLLLTLLALVATGCSSPAGGRQPRLGLAPSVLPNLGLELAGDARVGRLAGGDLRAEAHVAQQPFDDKDVSDDGNRPAGDYTQAGLGFRWVAWPEAGGGWELSAALVWLEARGAPNLIDIADTYLGLRVGVGWRVRYGEHLDFGPELSVIVAESDRDTVLLPQFTWGLRWRW